MPAQRPLQIDADIDLELFCAYLWKLGIRHRVYEEQGQQVVEVADPSQSEAVREQYAAWRSGRLTLARADTGTAREPRFAHALGLAWQYPALASLVLVTLVCFPATWSLDYGELSGWVRWLTFVDVTLDNGRPHYADLATTLASGQLWRLVTPVFLHFSVAHLLFNMAVIIEFGRRVERGLGGLTLLGMVLAIAVASNLAQYLATGPGLFGGMSGVAYGLVGFVVVRGRRAPENPLWQVSRSFVVAVVGFLVLMSTGVTELFGLHIANAAHWIGLCVGALLGLPGATRPARELS
jgi:GlpG protein